MLAVLLILLAVPPLLFVLNGVVLARGEKPVGGTTSHPAASLPDGDAPTVKVMAYNIAKGFAHKGGLSFERRETVEKRVEQLAEVIRAEQPDLVFLSEAMTECSPCPVNQVTSLAEQTGMHSWVFGENYNFGLPFYRLVGGNAILSRWPLEPVANPSLAGRQPFYVTRNNRRALWGAVQIRGRRMLLASLHNDTFNHANNRTQMEQILAFAPEEDVLLAGDFNATPNSPSIKLVRESGRLAGAFEGPNTFPADKPDRRIDFIFGPANWQLVEHHVVESDASDHRPVVSTFRLQ